MQSKILTFACLFLVTQTLAQSLGFGILPMPQATRQSDTRQAKTISDLYPAYPASWVKSYVRVDLAVTRHGETFHARGSNLNFNNLQSQLLNTASSGSVIQLTVTYYPNNDLPKEVKQMDFTLYVIPDQDAMFPGGKETLEAYLKENAIDPLSKYVDAGLHQAKVRFTISSTGEVLEASLSERSPFNAVNDILLQTITSMPRWIPACNNDGISASQDFEFIVTRDLCGFGSLMQ